MRFTRSMTTANIGLGEQDRERTELYTLLPSGLNDDDERRESLHVHGIGMHSTCGHGVRMEQLTRNERGGACYC